MVNIEAIAVVKRQICHEISMLPLFRDSSTSQHLSELQGWMISLPADASIWQEPVKIIELQS